MFFQAQRWTCTFPILFSLNYNLHLSLKENSQLQFWHEINAIISPFFTVPLQICLFKTVIVAHHFFSGAKLSTLNHEICFLMINYVLVEKINNEYSNTLTYNIVPNQLIFCPMWIQTEEFSNSNVSLVILLSALLLLTASSWKIM